MSNKKKNNDLDLDVETLSRLQQVIDMLGERTEAMKISSLSRGAIQKIYYGQSSPKFEAVKRLCIAAGLSMDWVATGKAQLSSSDDDFWKLPSSYASVYELDKKPSKGGLAYFERKDGKALLGLIEKENKNEYHVLVVIPGEETKSKKLIIEKSDLKAAYPAQIIKSLSD